MKKIIFGILLLLILAISVIGSSNSNVKVNQIMLLDEVVSAGGEINLYVNVENQNSYDLDDVIVSVIIPDLDLMSSSSRFDIESDDKESKNIVLDVPYDADADQYWIRISVSNDDFRRVVYRLVDIEDAN